MSPARLMNNSKECFKCLFYVINTFIAVRALTGALWEVVAASLVLSEAGQHELVKLTISDSDNTLYAVVVTGAKVFGISTVLLGLFQIVQSTLGCCGSMCKNPALLKMYWIGAIILIIFNLFTMGTASYMLDKTTRDIESRLMEAMRKYDGQNNFNTYFIDYSQVTLECCGIRSREDFRKSLWHAGGFTGVPFSCCQPANHDTRHSFGSSSRRLELSDLKDPSCPSDPGQKSYTTKPCLKLIKERQKSTFVTIIIACLCGMLFEGVMGYVARQIQQRLEPVVYEEEDDGTATVTTATEEGN